jgi:hypothetical protein
MTLNEFKRVMRNGGAILLVLSIIGAIYWLLITFLPVFTIICTLIIVLGFVVALLGVIWEIIREPY